MRKTIFIIFILLLNPNIFGSEQDVFQESLDKFEKYCFDQDDNLREDVFVKDEMYSCKSELEYLQHEFKRRENLMSQHTEVYDQYKNCVENRNNPKVSNFAEQGEDLADKVSCLDEEKEDFEKDCSLAMQCNVLRSILDGVDILPSPLEKPVKRFIRKQASSKGYSKECMADDKSNCLEDFSNALIDNLWSSATSVFNLAKASFKSLFNMTGFFDSQSDKALTAMNQSTEDVKTFMDSPGEWLVGFYDDLIAGVDSWVRSSVFCQKWKYNSEIEERGGQTDLNSATFRTCIKPLESYACIDCDDRINATCIALGALTAEVGVAFLTAGVGTAASFATKAGAKSLSLVAKKVATKIKAVSPKMSKNLKPPTTKLGIAVKATTAAIGNATKIAMTIASVTTKQALKVKSKIGLAIKNFKNTKIVKVTSNAIEKGNIPARVSEYFGTKGALYGAKVTTKVGKGAVKKEAELMVKISQKANKSTRGKNFLDDRSHGNSRAYSHTSKSHKAMKKGELANSNSNRPSRHSSKTESSSKTSDKKDSTKKSESKVSTNDSSTKRKDQKTKDQKIKDQKTKDQKLANDQNSRDKKANDQKLANDKKNKDKKDAADKKKREDQIAADKKAQEDHKKNEDARKRNISLAAAGVTADLAIKGINISNAEAEKEIKRLEKHSKGKGEVLSKNLSSAKKVLGVEGKSVFNAKSIKKVENLKEMYSTKNKDTVVSSMRKSNPSMSKNEAEQAFKKRRENVNNASEYIQKNRDLNKRASNNNSSKSSSSSKIKNLQNQIAKEKSKGELDSVNSELASLREQRKALEEGSGDSSKSESISDSTVKDSSPVAALIPVGSEDYNSSNRPISNRRAQSQSRSIAGASSGQASSVGASQDGPSSFSDDSDVGVESSEGNSISNEEVAAIDDLQEAQGELDPTAEEEEKKVAELEKKDRKKSKNLKDLLGLISKKGIKVEEDVPVRIDLKNVKTSNIESAMKLNRLKALSSSGEKAKKLVTYTLVKGKLEVFHFEDDTYSLATSLDGQIEMLSDINSRLLIENSLGQVE